MTAAQAAAYLGESPTTKASNISARARTGKIPDAVKMGRDWLLPIIWVEAEKKRRDGMAAQGIKMGRPRKNQ